MTQALRQQSASLTTDPIIHTNNYNNNNYNNNNYNNNNKRCPQHTPPIGGLKPTITMTPVIT